MFTHTVPHKPITAICVAHGTAVPHIRLIRDELLKFSQMKCIDLTDDSSEPRFHNYKHLRMMDGFEDINPVLVLGLSEWSKREFDANPGERDALHYAANGPRRPDRPQHVATATCLVTDSLGRLDPILACTDNTYKKRERVRLVAVHGQVGGHMGRRVYQDLIRRFPNLQAPYFLCFKEFDAKAARLVARRIRHLV